MILYVIDTAESPTPTGNLVLHPINRWTGVAVNAFMYVSMLAQPSIGIVVGLWHPTSKKRLKKWVNNHRDIAATYKQFLEERVPTLLDYELQNLNDVDRYVSEQDSKPDSKDSKPTLKLIERGLV